MPHPLSGSIYAASLWEDDHSSSSSFVVICRGSLPFVVCPLSQLSRGVVFGNLPFVVAGIGRLSFFIFVLSFSLNGIRRSLELEGGSANL